MKRTFTTLIAIISFLILVPETGTAAPQIENEAWIHISGELIQDSSAPQHGEVVSDWEHEINNAEHGGGHEGPVIPSSKWEIIFSFDVGDTEIHITNTVLSTWVFMILLCILVGVFHIAISTDKMPRLKAFGLDIVARILAYTTGLLGDRGIAKRYVWLLGGLMVVIFLGNLYGLMLDWFVLVSYEHSLGKYLRPMYSDLSTTLVFSLTVIMVAQFSAIRLKGFVHHFGHYLFNYHGDSTAEKVVSVFIGWLHFAGEFIRIGSLSMRLFLNIFVGMILISVAIYVWGKIPSYGMFRLISLPFWFFELLVAFLQAYIFMTLSSLYIRESIPEKTSH
jgi:F0F1-type ATP synthase membrane subunit a